MVLTQVVGVLLEARVVHQECYGVVLYLVGMLGCEEISPPQVRELVVVSQVFFRLLWSWVLPGRQEETGKYQCKYRCLVMECLMVTILVSFQLT